MTKTNFTLYQISEEYVNAIDGYNLEDGLDLETIQGKFEDKCIAVAKYIKNLEAEYVAVKQASDDMLKRAKVIAKKSESLEEYLSYHIQKTGLLDPIKTPEFVIKLKSNPPSLLITNLDLIPNIYKITQEVITIDKASLKQDIKDGFEVEGATLQSLKRVEIK